MPRYWFEDSWTVHRLVAVEAESEEDAWDKLTDGSDTWVHEETVEGVDFGGWDQTTAEEFHDEWGPEEDNILWKKDGLRILTTVEGQPSVADETSPQPHSPPASTQ